ncbi:hypothetical protein CYLTODRAFT_253424 [Cylindrobasidium torrendii FP15055 ss-10]|uniref:Uncharacterized protein n=1 Tax=Cylindrobasidium torrendii FP15055 ss-10 TaxID=1314674 RepID=A0A0D7BDG9_9AGAR|nr:hypothetical protein CYLTODRAFT_253424 [Cylindrobasidium torrendii FP15055 ss-10]
MPYLTRGVQKKVTARYSALPDELRHKIMKTAIQSLEQDLTKELLYGLRKGTLSSAMYEYALAFKLDMFRQHVLDRVAIEDGTLYTFFLQSVREKPGVALGLTCLTLRGHGLHGQFDWTSFVEARKRIRRLTSLSLIDLDVGETDAIAVAQGLKTICYERCTLTTGVLTVAMTIVPSVRAKHNTYLNTHITLTQYLHKQSIRLIANSDSESSLYATILSYIHSVSSLVVRGVKAGWQLGGGWDGVQAMLCAYGLPRQIGSTSTMRHITLGGSDTVMHHLITLIPRGYDKKITIGIDVGFGTAPEMLAPIWQALNQLSHASVRVKFNVGGRTPGQIEMENQNDYIPLLRTSNRQGDMLLCPDANIQVYRTMMPLEYRNE